MGNVTFQKSIAAKKKMSLYEAAQSEHIKLKAPCKGKGKCGKCLVKVISGKASPPTDNELKLISEKKLKNGYRLACEIRDMDDLVVEWPEK